MQQRWGGGGGDGGLASPAEDPPEDLRKGLEVFRGSVLCVGNRSGALFGVFRQVSECGEQRLAWGPKCHSTARDPGDRFSDRNPNLFKNIV